MTYGSQRTEEFGHQCMVCRFFSDVPGTFADHRCEENEERHQQIAPIFEDTGDDVEVNPSGVRRWGRRFRRVS